MNEEKETIVLRHIQKTFPVDGGVLEVFKDFDLSIPQREITVVLGKSGCGKTTLLRMIGGLDRDYEGTIESPGDARAAFVFQEPRLMPWLNVWDNITFGLKKKEIHTEEINRLLMLVGLAGFGQAYPRQLSGGMSQRVALARALALKPRFLLMDEPFAALDYFTRNSMQDALLEIHSQNDCGVLFVTHNIEEAMRLGDRIVIIDQKKVKKVYHLREKQNTAALKEDILQLMGNSREDYKHPSKPGL